MHEFLSTFSVRRVLYEASFSEFYYSEYFKNNRFDATISFFKSHYATTVEKLFVTPTKLHEVILNYESPTIA